VVDLVGAGVMAPWDDPDMWLAAQVAVHETTNSAELALAQLEGRTVIEATGAQVGEVAATNVSNAPPVVWVYARSNVRDALWFWNIRALVPRSFRYSPMAIVSLSTARSLPFRDDLRRWLAGRHRGTTPDLIVNSLSVQKRDLKELVRALGLELHAGSLQTHWGSTSEGRLAAAIQVDVRELVLGERVAGLRTTTVVGVEYPRTTIRAPSPVTFRRPAGGHVMVRISELPFFNVPKRQPVARLIQHNAEWRDGGLQFERMQARSISSSCAYRLRLMCSPLPSWKCSP